MGSDPEDDGLEDSSSLAPDGPIATLVDGLKSLEADENAGEIESESASTSDSEGESASKSPEKLLDAIAAIARAFEDSPRNNEDTAGGALTALQVSEVLKKKPSDTSIELLITQEVESIIKAHSALNSYEVVFLYDFKQIDRLHASAIYQHLSQSSPKNEKDILLILKSPGGEVEPAYLISKMCTRFKKSKFIIGIPAEAKSAATLLALGADELHMGAMSELGPIDPQINDFPALAFYSALEKIAELAQKFPGASDMLAKYLIGSELDVRALGHYDRITESSAHYALRLLQSKATAIDDDETTKLETLACHFTNHYKDHNFVIDIDEAQKLLTKDVVKADTDIYLACNEIHKFLEMFEGTMLVRGVKKRVSAMGRKFYISSTTEKN